MMCRRYAFQMAASQQHGAVRLGRMARFACATSGAEKFYERIVSCLVVGKSTLGDAFFMTHFKQHSAGGRVRTSCL